MPTSGKSLRRLRRSKEITTVALHKAMGISRGTLWNIERAAEVEPEQAEAYRAAVKTLSDAKGDKAA